jgi:hypothetical protein
MVRRHGLHKIGVDRTPNERTGLIRALDEAMIMIATKSSNASCYQLIADPESDDNYDGADYLGKHTLDHDLTETD